MGKTRTIAGEPPSSPVSMIGQRDLRLDITKSDELGELNREIADRKIEIVLEEHEIPKMTIDNFSIVFPKKP